MAHQMTSRMTSEMRRCIDECLSCYGTCEFTSSHCLELGGKHAEAVHIRLLADCARICLAAADFMTRGSDSHARLCETCADICRQCAESCERVDSADETMKQCVAECRRCADACEQMARAA